MFRFLFNLDAIRYFANEENCFLFPEGGSHGFPFEKSLFRNYIQVEKNQQTEAKETDMTFCSKTILLALLLPVPAVFSGAEESRPPAAVDQAAAELLTDLKNIEVKDSVVFYNRKPFSGLISLDSLRETDLRLLEKVFPAFFYRQLTAAPFKKESMLLELRNGLFHSVRIKANDNRDTCLVLSLQKNGGFLRRLFQDNTLKVEQEFNRMGRAHGKFISYHPNGNPFFTAEYQDGANFGVMRRFAPDGRLLKEVRLDNNITVTTQPKKKK